MKTKLKFLVISFIFNITVLYLITSQLDNINTPFCQLTKCPSDDIPICELENQVFSQTMHQKTDPINTQLLYADFVKMVRDYRISRDDLCTQNPKTSAIIWVMSRVNVTDQRNAIRKTWAQTLYYGNSTIKLVFVLGLADDSAIQNRVTAEEREFQDILQFDFLDSEHNDTLKTIGVLRWTHLYCKSVEFVIKIEDYFMIDTTKLKEFFGWEVNHKTTIFGIKGENYKPDRNVSSQWYVSEEAFPEDKYPDFMFGPYVMTADCVRVLYEKSLKALPALWLEEVYVTGIVAKNTGIVLEDFRYVLFPRIIIGRIGKADEMYSYWNVYIKDQAERALHKPFVGTLESDPNLPDYEESNYHIENVNDFNLANLEEQFDN